MNSIAKQILTELQEKLDNNASAMELLDFMADHHLFSIDSTLQMIQDHNINPIQAIKTAHQFWFNTKVEILMEKIIEVKNPQNN